MPTFQARSKNMTISAQSWWPETQTTFLREFFISSPKYFSYTSVRSLKMQYSVSITVNLHVGLYHTWKRFHSGSETTLRTRCSGRTLAKLATRVFILEDCCRALFSNNCSQWSGYNHSRPYSVTFYDDKEEELLMLTVALNNEIKRKWTHEINLRNKIPTTENLSPQRNAWPLLWGLSEEFSLKIGETTVE